MDGAIDQRADDHPVGRQDAIREHNGVRSGMERGAGRRKRGIDRGAGRENGRRQRPEGERFPSADADGGLVLMTRLVETTYAARRQA
jgi:hypothetical protein